MPQRRADERDDPLPATRLPRELVYFYVVAPLFTSPLLSRDFFNLPLEVIPRAIAGNYVPFLFIPAAVHLLYRFVMPSLHRLFRVRRLPAWVALNAGASAVTAAAVGILIRPIMSLFSNKEPQALGFVAQCVIITWTFILPALVMQNLRDRAHEAERRLAEERQAALRAQIEAIQSRTNPHFLFNAMNTVANLIHEDPKLAERTLERLADILRYALQRSGIDEVPLKQEIAMVEDYLEVQRARFGERLRYAIEIEPGLEAAKLPPFLLQPLVENAVLHGIAERPDGGAVRLVVRRRGGRVELRVDDDGPGPGASPRRGTGTSLDDLKRRLNLLYGDASHVVTRANESGGFTVEVAVPESGARA
jgi:two-component system sensor histidine kinase AlgZ